MALKARGSKSHNEHGVDCVAFFSLASRARWSVIRDFMSDCNGTYDIDIGIRVDETIRCNGTCGARPDEILVSHDKHDELDAKADRFKWSVKRKQAEQKTLVKIKDLRRKSFLYAQVQETLITGSAPLESMTKEEQQWFLQQVTGARLIAKEAKKKREENEQKALQNKAIEKKESEERWSIAWTVGKKPSAPGWYAVFFCDMTDSAYWDGQKWNVNWPITGYVGPFAEQPEATEVADAKMTEMTL